MNRFFTFLISCLITCITAGSYAQEKSIVKYNLTESQYQKEFESMKGKNYIPGDIDVIKVGNKTRFAVVWIKNYLTAWQARHGMTETEFNHTDSAFRQKGYYIQNLVPYYNEQNQLRFAATWEERDEISFAKYDMTEERYESAINTMKETGVYPTRITVYEHAGAHKYAVIWSELGKISGGYLNGMEQEACRQALATMAEKGYYLMDLTAYTKDKKTYYSAYWFKVKLESRTTPDLSLDDLEATVKTNAADGYRAYTITGYIENGKLYYGASWSK